MHLPQSPPAALLFPSIVLQTGDGVFFSGGLWCGHPYSWAPRAASPSRYRGPSSLGHPALVLHQAPVFSLSSLVTMDTVEKAPLPTEADRWHSGSEQMNDREGTGDLVSSPCALSYLQKGFEGDVSL